MCSYNASLVTQYFRQSGNDDEEQHFSRIYLQCCWISAMKILLLCCLCQHCSESCCLGDCCLLTHELRQRYCLSQIQDPPANILDIVWPLQLHVSFSQRITTTTKFTNKVCFLEPLVQLKYINVSINKWHTGLQKKSKNHLKKKIIADKETRKLIPKQHSCMFNRHIHKSYFHLLHQHYINNPALPKEATAQGINRKKKLFF